MGPIRRELVALLIVAAFTSCALAEQRKTNANLAVPAAQQRTLTGKERLGPKWTDEQRIDNCKVPLDKRGTKPRPSACADAPPS
jgi:hypothetical protein